MAYLIEKSNPERAGRIMAMLAAGETYSAIHAETGASHATIARIASTYPETVEQWRKVAGERAKTAAELAITRLTERLADPDVNSSIKDLSISYGILTDKSLVLQGEATAIQETRTGMSVASARQAIEQARKTIDAEVIDV